MNNRVISEYLESLKEDDELDYIFPILLESMGFQIVSTPKNSKGQSQYGKDVIEIHRDAITEDDVVLIHDDVLATGGTMAAAYNLVKSLNPKKIYINFIIELSFLHGRDLLPADAEVTSLITY